jgi:acetyl/propionyl-CoA carboxylase alpha subunit
MEYKIKTEDAIYPVQVDPLGDHLYRVSFMDRTHLVDVSEVSENLYSMICDGRSYEVDIMEEGDIYEVFIKGRSYWGEILRPDKMAVLPEKGKEAVVIPEEEVLASPLTCKVVKILVKEGEAVEIDQVLVIIEAMKMEMPISSPIRGKVKEVLVKEGQDVDKGTNLVILTSL